MQKLLILILVGFLTSGCAVGVKHRYDAANAEFNIVSDSKIAVGVHDQRPYVVTGDKSPDFVGLSRGGFGNPFNVKTASGNPLAEDFAASIVQALKADGHDASQISLAPGASNSAAKESLFSSLADRYVMVTLEEWKADTYNNTALIYNLSLRVYDSIGNETASKRLGGRDNLGGSVLNPPEHARGAIPIAFKGKLEEMFNDPEVAAALK